MFFLKKNRSYQAIKYSLQKLIQIDVEFYQTNAFMNDIFVFCL
jgi:hypothetical protein